MSSLNKYIENKWTATISGFSKPATIAVLFLMAKAHMAFV
jgi:hypothetical protein